MSAQILNLQKRSESREDIKIVPRKIWWGQVLFTADAKKEGDNTEACERALKNNDGSKTFVNSIISKPIFVEALNKRLAGIKIINYFSQMRPDTKYHDIYDSLIGEDGPYQVEILKQSKAR